MNIKIPKTQYPVSEIVKNRWSARSFTGEGINEATLHTLFEAASWAASSMNEQPWLFTYAHKEDEAAFEKFHSCLLSGNSPWAKNASVLILLCARTNFVTNGKPNRHAMFDCGAATTTLFLEAVQHNILGHMMGGFDMVKTKELFNLPEDLEPCIFIALGQLAAPDLLEEPFKTREITPRSRKPVSEIAFKNHF
ncbi:MAG: nitroreductase family protein [Cytophagales bacterium]